MSHTLLPFPSARLMDFIQGLVSTGFFLHQSDRTYHFLKSQEFKECKFVVITMAEDLRGFHGGVEKLFPEQMNALKAFI